MTDPEEARSDLFLAAGVYLFGPILLGLLRGLSSIPVLGQVWLLAVPLITTALVPVLMARYRREGLAHYGLVRDADDERLGLMLSAPLVVAITVSGLFAGQVAFGTVPGLVLGLDAVVPALANLLSWAGLVVLAVYVTVKARDAFRSEPRPVPTVAQEVGRWLGIVGGIAAVLLALSQLQDLSVGLVLIPLAAVGAVWLLLRRVGSTRSTTGRAVLVTPVVLLALGPLNLFALFGQPIGFLAGVWQAAIVGTVGLLVGTMMETRRTAAGAVTLGLVLALLVPVGLVTATG